MNRLTQAQKTKYIDTIVERDGGFKCFTVMRSYRIKQANLST